MSGSQTLERAPEQEHNDLETVVAREETQREIAFNSADQRKKILNLPPGERLAALQAINERERATTLLAAKGIEHSQKEENK